MQSKLVVWMPVMQHTQQGMMEDQPTVGGEIPRSHRDPLAAMAATPFQYRLKGNVAPGIQIDLRVLNLAEP
jgi:hypothetical protein